MLATSEGPSVKPRKRPAVPTSLRKPIATTKATITLALDVDTKLSILAAIRRTDRSTLVAEALAPLLKGLVVQHRGNSADHGEFALPSESAA